MARLGQYPPADALLVHLSDIHVHADGAPLGGRIDTLANLRQALNRVGGSGLRPDAFVVTGDVTEAGEPDGYRLVRELVDPVADRLGSRVVWVMGNHDDRDAFRRRLLDDEGGRGEPVETTVTIDGLRIIVLDTSVPGYHHGALTDGQLDRLRGLLARTSPRGTILVMHHPPIPTPLPVMTVLELQDQDRLAGVLAGSDVRAILAGHLHYNTTGMFAGIPVFVAGATSYTMDLAAPFRETRGVAGAQSFSLVRVYGDAVVTASIPLAHAETVTRFGEEVTDRLESLDHAGRISALSRMPREPEAPR